MNKPESFITIVLEQKVLTNKVIEILLSQYNEQVADPDEPLLLVETENAGCFGTGLEYTFYKVFKRDRGSPFFGKGNTLSESDTMLWLSHELNNQ